jgi:hypothetical protein
MIFYWGLLPHIILHGLHLNPSPPDRVRILILEGIVHFCTKEDYEPMDRLGKGDVLEEPLDTGCVW